MQNFDFQYLTRVAFNADRLEDLQRLNSGFEQFDPVVVPV
jgi:hypothetical protein